MSLGSFFPTAMILHVFAIANNFPVYSAAGNGLDDVPVTSLAPVSRRWHGGVPPVSEGWLALRTSARAMAAALSALATPKQSESVPADARDAWSSSRGTISPASVKTTASSAMRQFRHRAGLRTSVYRVSSYGTAKGIIAGVLGALVQAPEADDAPVMLVLLPQ
jgi:hypothetical protein